MDGSCLMTVCRLTLRILLYQQIQSAYIRSKCTHALPIYRVASNLHAPYAHTPCAHICIYPSDAFWFPRPTHLHVTLGNRSTAVWYSTYQPYKVRGTDCQRGKTKKLSKIGQVFIRTGSSMHFILSCNERDSIAKMLPLQVAYRVLICL